MPTVRVHCPHQQAQPRIRTPPHGQALHHWACAHVVEGLFMRLWSRPLIVAGIGVVPQGPEEGPPTGTHSGPAQQNRPRGGRAWPGFETTRRANHQHTRLHWCGGRRRDRRARAGFEIDHSEPQARVWRSRGRAAAHQDAQRPAIQGRSPGARNTSGATNTSHTTAQVRQGGGHRSTHPP